jgi:pimeloyl-ACP methyl ester carboxylesterase
MTFRVASGPISGWKIATFAILRAMKNRSRSALKALALLLACSCAIAADGPARRFDCGPTSRAVSSQAEGRLLILPGVGNTRFHLAAFVAAAQAQLPGFDVEVRPWGVPFMTIHNLRAHERNVATVERIAAEIAAWRSEHPDAPFYLVGYSGGGGMATLVAAALPDDVRIDRLVLVAPAISPDFPLIEAVVPHVREHIVNYASERDLQVGWGTRTFGTIDRKNTASAGSLGFDATHERLLEYRWSEADAPFGHAGNHLAYLNPRWQAAKLLPALHPSVGAAALRAHWAHTCKEF